MSGTQWLSWSTARTVLFFLMDSWKISGARSFGAIPSSHGEVQNLAYSSLLTFMGVAAVKRHLSASSHGISMPTQDFQSYLASFARLRTPSFVGQHTLYRLTLHFPPIIASVPDERIHRLIWSRSRRINFGTLKAVR